MTNITIDGKPYTVKDGITIIEAIDQNKIDLPRYCYHPALSIAGNCRICQVEVDQPRLPAGRQGTVIACNTRVADGMVIHTRSPKAKESQEVVLEFLLANHPLDCPVCDQAGECKLQDYYMDYGLYDPKFNDVKVKKKKKAFAIGPTILLDQERCILCTRCVRFADEITKTNDFGVFNRGDHAELDIYPGKELNNNYSGNVADICPVGALTDRDFRFKMRVWYLGSEDSICPGCARGCNIEIHYEKSRPYHLKNERVMRLRPRENPGVNKWWICDAGRYGYKPIDFNRIQQMKAFGVESAFEKNGGSTSLTTTLSEPFGVAQDKLRESMGGIFGEALWKEALGKLAALLKAADPKKWALLASAQYTNEELYLMKRIFKDHLKWENTAFWAPGQDGDEDDFLIKKDKNPNSAGAAQILVTDGPDKDMTPLVEKAKRGELEGIFIFHHDLAKIYGAEALDRIRRGVKTILYEGANVNPTAAAADVVLPAASYAEKEGTFTNFEGRVQRIRKALEPLAVSQPTWQTLTELGALLGMPLPYKKPEEIFHDLARENEAFRGMDYKKIGSQGIVWNKTQPSLRGA